MKKVEFLAKIEEIDLALCEPGFVDLGMILTSQRNLLARQCNVQHDTSLPMKEYPTNAKAAPRSPTVGKHQGST